MLHVIAFGTDKQAYFDLFMASCRRCRVEPILLGWGTPWVGYGKKTTDIRTLIQDYPADDVVLSVDPFDVVFMGTPDEIEARFRRRPAAFLCGALRLSRRMARIYEHEFNRSGRPTPRTPSGYDYLNSGTWIATAGHARRVIDRLVGQFGMRGTDMDQEILTTLYITEPETVALDWQCEIFHNLLFVDFVTRRPDLKDLAFEDGRLVNTVTGARPCLLHASGNARLGGVAHRLGYDGPAALPAGQTTNFLRKAGFHIKTLLSLVRRH